MKPVPGDALTGWTPLPCEDPRFFLVVRAQRKDQHHSQLGICTINDLRLLCTASDLETMTGKIGMFDWGYYRSEPRAHWLPSAKVITVFPMSNDRVVVYPFDVREELNRQEGGYLFVVSKPPLEVLLGDTFVYPLEVWSKAKELKFKLESGPEGMTVSGTGEIRWPVKSKPLGGQATAVVSVSDGSHEVFHAFDVKVIRTNRPRESGGEPAPAAGAGSRQAAVAKPAEAAATAPALVDAFRWELPSANTVVSPGLNQRLLLSDDRSLYVLAKDGKSIEARHALPKSYSQLIEREKYWVGLGREPRAIETIDKATGTVVRSLALGAAELVSLAAHPGLPVSYLSLKNAGSLPHFKFITFQETTGNATEDHDWIGNWLAVTPDGRYLLSGYSDIFQRGSQFIFNPDRIHVVPDYGNIDWLLRFELDEQGTPSADALKTQVGGNGRGLRLSADGNRVSYLSVVGSPPFSGNLAAWDPYDFAKVPVSYATKDRAGTTELAFHPWLPLVATLGEKKPVFFHRETGALEDDRLESLPESLGDKLHHLEFSPDGKRLLIRSSVNDTHYLLQLPLRLSKEESRPTARPLPARPQSGKGRVKA